MTRRKLRRYARWFVAVAVAAIWSIKRFTWPEIWQAVKSILSAIFAEKKGDASRTLYIRRMMACHRCPIFNRRFGTCGSPFDEHPELGCWCWVWLKNKMKGAKCWLREHSDLRGVGWRSKLMRKSW